MPLHTKILSIKDRENVHNWLENNGINPIKIRRHFSDVYAVAELVKKYYPKLVDLYNYPKKNSFQLKLINWETFEHKVLSKLGLTLTSDFLRKLANGDLNAIEVLLYEFIKLQKRVRKAEERAAEERQEQVWAENDDVRTIVVNKQVGDGIVQVPQKMILYSMYEKILREKQAKEAMIESYNSKIDHLENIIKIKEERIEELQLQLGKFTLNPVTLSPSMSRNNIYEPIAEYKSSMNPNRGTGTPTGGLYLEEPTSSSSKC